MKTKHTPGPWDLCRQGIEIQSDPNSEYFGHEVFVVANGIPCSLCCVPLEQTASNHGEPGVLHISKSESLANARLMAAAPELLEALENLVETLRPKYGNGYPLVDAIAAISRAMQEAQP